MRGLISTLLFLQLTSIAFAQQVIYKSGLSPQSLISRDFKETSTKINERNFNPTQFKSDRNNIIKNEHEAVLVGKRAPDSVNIYELALFGGYQKTQIQLEEDDSFLKDCEKNFSSKEEAGSFFVKMGWQYMSEGSKEMAISRFNLAWLLDSNNMEVYWGLGVVAYQKEEFQEAIKLMSQGMEKDTSDNVSLMVDLATVHIKCFTKNQHDIDLPKSYRILKKAVEINPQFPNAYRQLALANLINGQIDEAWMSFHEAYKLDPESANASILSDLLIRKPDPMGIFHSFD